ncbi:MAG: hypothetical protein ACK56I_16610, partial [bacterium]
GLGLGLPRLDAEDGVELLATGGVDQIDGHGPMAGLEVLEIEPSELVLRETPLEHPVQQLGELCHIVAVAGLRELGEPERLAVLVADLDGLEPPSEVVLHHRLILESRSLDHLDVHQDALV